MHHLLFGLALIRHSSLRGLYCLLVCEVVVLHGPQVLVELIDQRDTSGDVQLHDLSLRDVVFREY